MSIRAFEMFRRFTAGLVVAISVSTAVHAQEQSYNVGDVRILRVPQSVFLEKDFFAYYDKRLVSLEEESLWKLSKNANHESYRFIWAPLEGSALVIRIDFETQDEGTITIKRSTGVTAEDWGDVSETKVSKLTTEQIDLFRFEFSRLNYWFLPREFEGMQMNGSLWLIEAANQGMYHTVPRYNPNLGLLFEFERFLVRFVGLEDDLVKLDTGAAEAE